METKHKQFKPNKRRVNIQEGDKYGRLTILKEIEPVILPYGTYRQFLCKCDCGNETTTTLNLLRQGKKKSCGCLFKERNPKILKPKSRITYKMENTRLYHIWCGMKQRCYNKNKKGYKNYGGRNIQICDEWLKFENFYSWAISNGYEDNLTIDRIDSNGNYEPSNCRWASWKQQENNKRTNRYITVKGETKTLSEWSRVTGLGKETIRWRLENGWGIDKIFQPSTKKN